MTLRRLLTLTLAVGLALASLLALLAPGSSQPRRVSSASAPAYSTREWPR